MKKISEYRVLRRLLVLSVLVSGLANVGFNSPNRVRASDPCDEAFVAWDNANTNYDAAFQLYYFNNPTTCAASPACVGLSGAALTSCISDCETTRHSALNAADIALFNAAWNTCSPATLDQCDQARLMAGQCAIDYDYLSYTDQEQSLAIYAEYSDCILASKVAACQ